jgi:hypothetical protein
VCPLLSRFLNSGSPKRVRAPVAFAKSSLLNAFEVALIFHPAHMENEIQCCKGGARGTGEGSGSYFAFINSNC